MVLPPLPFPKGSCFILAVDMALSVAVAAKGSATVVESSGGERQNICTLLIRHHSYSSTVQRA